VVAGVLDVVGVVAAAAGEGVVAGVAGEDVVEAVAGAADGGAAGEGEVFEVGAEVKLTDDDGVVAACFAFNDVPSVVDDEVSSPSPPRMYRRRPCRRGRWRRRASRRLARALPVPLTASVPVRVRFSTLAPRVKETEDWTRSVPPAADAS
jgi:hypothetical protein